MTIDLKNENFIPGKKNYERTRIALEERLKQNFDVIVTWDPPGISVFPFFLSNVYVELFIYFAIIYIFKRSICAHHL